MKRFVDAHHHVWSLARGDCAWLTPALAPIYRDFSMRDYAPLAEWAGVETSIVVQAAPTLKETRYLLDVAHSNEAIVRGVVGWVDLAARNAIPTLNLLSRDSLFKAVRPMLQDLADPEWILLPAVQPALAALPRLSLRLEALVRPAQLPALLKALERHPDLAVVVDHGAKPPICSGEWEPWASLIRAVASSPRTRCKLSGLVTEAAADWTIDVLRPYTDHLLACFGPERLMWGSDWPVVELGGGFKRWRAASIALLDGLEVAQRDAILGDNARRIYGLE